MNIFVLDKNPNVAAQYHCDKHVVKMIVESGQMLSTSHRVLDGYEVYEPTTTRWIKKWKHPVHDDDLYASAFVNHPCSKWTRASLPNYKWHFKLFKALVDEYKFRYGKAHKTWDRIAHIVIHPPNNIPDVGMTDFALAMGSNPECIDNSDPVSSYRSFYKKKDFEMVWTNRDKPNWF